MLAVDLAAQLVPGTFEHAVHHLVTYELDLSQFDARFRNDVTDATAYPPAMLLAVVLCAYARGIVSSRAIARACEEQVTFIALCGDTRPHFTTIAHFISTTDRAIAAVFAAVLQKPSTSAAASFSSNPIPHVPMSSLTCSKTRIGISVAR